MIVGLASFKNELWIFKGPHKLSIHRITGSTPSGADAFARTTFIDGLSAANQHCIFQMGDDLGFVSPRGTVHSLKATNAFGDYNQAYLNYPILSWCRDNMNQNRRRFWQAVTDPLRSYTLITFPLTGNTNNDRCLLLDWRFLAQGEPYPRWSLWDFGSFASLGYAIDTSNRPRIFAGAYDGFVYRLDQSARTHNSTSIRYEITSPHLTYGSEYYLKTINCASIGHASKNTNTATFGWTIDGGTEQTQTFTQAGGGFQLDSSVLDGPDLLGGGTWSQRFLNELTGQGRSLQYHVTENVNNSDIEI